MVPPGERTRRYRLSDMLTQWRRTTDIRKQDTKDRNLRISKGQNPYPVGDLRRGGLFEGPGPEESIQIRLGRQGPLQVLNLCRGPALDLVTGTKLQDLDYLRVQCQDSLAKRCQALKVVVVECFADLDHGPQHAGTRPDCILI